MGISEKKKAPQKTPHNGKGFPSRQSPGGVGGGH